MCFLCSFYSISKEIAELGGSGLLEKYSFSPSQLITTVYSDLGLLPWKFVNTPRNYWNNNKNVKRFIEWAKGELNIKDMNDWYSVTAKVSK